MYMVSRILIKFALLAVFVGLASCATSPPKSDYSKGLDAAIDGDYSNAIKLYEKAAASGDSDAMEMLGSTYLKGRKGVPKDVNKGLSWYHMASDAGNCAATDTLVTHYRGFRKDSGVEENLGMAYKLAILADTQGDGCIAKGSTKRMFFPIRVATMKIRGHGTPKDETGGLRQLGRLRTSPSGLI